MDGVQLSQEYRQLWRYSLLCTTIEWGEHSVVNIVTFNTVTVTNNVNNV